VPKPLAPAPVPIKESSFGSFVKQGFGWGIGNALAHKVVNSFTSNPEVSEPIPTLKFDSAAPAYKQCMLEFEDKEACKHLLK
jgi:hypothetical protein